MGIRRGDVPDIAWVFAWLVMKCLISNQQFYGFLIWLRHITAWGVRNPQNNFLVSSSRHLGIILVTDWEVSFLSDP